MRAVVEKNVCMTGSEIHGANARGRSAEMVPSGIAGGIGFRFDDAAADASSGKIVDDHFADEKPCECDSTGRQLRTAKTSEEGW